MSLDSEMERRRARLQALVDHEAFSGNKTKLGQALGYKDGAFVGHMLRGERAITEKTIAHVHTMQAGRFAGWFSGEERDVGTAAPAWPFEMIKPEAWDKLSPYDRTAAEEAARAKLRELAAERESSSGKRQGLAA